MRTVEVAPSAKTLIESMRDMGYTLETALADIVDNSIAANASTIDIFANFNDGDPVLGVLDNGIGLTEGDLLEAMRPGSQSPLELRRSRDLGRFGLGLKTASFSQCRRLTVVTRRSETTCVAVWDLDHVASVDRWCVQLPDLIEGIPWVDKLGSEGTLVVWQKTDRLLQQATKSENQQHFNRRVSDAIQHLELVFHRYLTGERDLNRVEMTLNEGPLRPRDPFLGATSDAKEILVTGVHQVIMEAFTMPHHSKVSRRDWERAEGRGGYVKNQGFYVYREKRLIIHGTWFGLARQTELTKLARVKIDIPNGLDAEWNIDVMKSRAHPPYVVRERLRKLIEAIGASSTRVYTQRRVRLTARNRLPVWDRTMQDGNIVYRVNLAHPLFEEFASRLDEHDRRAFSQVVEVISSSVPLDALCADLGADPEKVTSPPVERADLMEVTAKTVAKLRAASFGDSDIEAILGTAEPFRSHWLQTCEALAALGIQAAAQ